MADTNVFSRLAVIRGQHADIRTRMLANDGKTRQAAIDELQELADVAKLPPDAKPEDLIAHVTALVNLIQGNAPETKAPPADSVAASALRAHATRR